MNFLHIIRRMAAVWILLAVWACSPPAPKLSGFNRETWTADRNGCNGVRKPLADTLAAQRNVLLAQPESGIIEAIGKPDLVELYKRNQKFFHYFIAGAPACGDSTVTTSRLLIRFNAMGRAKEILIEQ